MTIQPKMVLFPSVFTCAVKLKLSESNFDLELSELTLCLHYSVHRPDTWSATEIKFTRAEITDNPTYNLPAFAQALCNALIAQTDLLDQISAHEDRQRPRPKTPLGYRTMDEYLDDPRREERAR